ncbi:DUF4350 domain-containing protein [Ornithinimicrobium sp. W1679]|uniref:DUF4350 domain-containing protein n=1 Tax=Ornithinimicrobium sp. W1665 TaxID=3416666 RepID=UPI003CFA7D59
MRRWVPWVLLLLGMAVVATLLTRQDTGEPLSPDNPGHEGTRALARVLEQQGTRVEVVDGTRRLLERPVGPGTTVLLGHTAYLGPEAGAELLAHVADADRLVVLVPDGSADPGAVLDLPVSTAPGGDRVLEAGCTAPWVRDGDLLARADVMLEVDGAERAAATACYPPTPSHNAGGARVGALLELPATSGHPPLTLVGFPSALTNEHVLEEAHAALGLRLLGGPEELVWVVPSPGDAPPDASAQGLWDVLPRNLTASVVLLAAAVLVTGLWQGRRLAPVVVEPLPAVVHAAETTRARGRLYRQAHDREHALGALQEGTRHRLAQRLGLPPATGTDDLVERVAATTGQPPGAVRRLLTDPTADDDATLVDVARRLRSLEEGPHR